MTALRISPPWGSYGSRRRSRPHRTRFPDHHWRATYRIHPSSGNRSATMLRMTEALDSDEALMLRYSAGDARAFEALYLRHEMKVWRYIYRSVCNQATADELMQ